MNVMIGKNSIKKTVFTVVALLFLAGAVWTADFYLDGFRDTNTPASKPDLIKVENVKPNQLVRSPLVVRGEARGYWFFEASFPVKLYDGDGNLLAVKPAQAKSDWMTENFVPFEVTLEFSSPDTEIGTLVLEKDNPSGLPEHADSISIPVKFR